MSNKLKTLFGMINLFWIKFIAKSAIIGKNSKIDYNVSIINLKSNISIGNNVYLRGIAKGYQAGMVFPTSLLADVPNSKITIGDNCRINGAYIHAQKNISIGKNCVIASNVNIMDTNGHVVYSNNRTRGRDEPREVVIGDNVWIGLNVVILKGTKIEKNSIVSAGSVVKGDFPANAIISGNPAKTVKIIRINDSNSQQ